MVQLDPKAAEEFQKYRPAKYSHYFCQAPFANLNFDQYGNAKVCCYNNTHVLGKVPLQSLEDIWFGEKAEQLREYMKEPDLSHGCELCAFQVNRRNFSNSRVLGFDHYVRSKLPIGKWLEKRAPKVRHPQCIEFELENTCNLECVMCNGKFSSLIRKNRENLPPLESPYGKEFLTQLETFIPHLTEAKFLGGEPFLIPIYYQIWEKILEQKPNIRVSITTNGTVNTKKVRQYLELLKPNLIISIDSIVKETYLKIRKNANFDKVMENVSFFHELTKKWGRELTFAVCPMTLNFSEMPELIRYCDERKIRVYFNTVESPHELSLSRIGAKELSKVRTEFESILEKGKNGFRLNRNYVATKHLYHSVDKLMEQKKALADKFTAVQSQMGLDINPSIQHYLTYQKGLYYVISVDSTQNEAIQLEKVMVTTLEQADFSDALEGIEACVQSFWQQLHQSEQKNPLISKGFSVFYELFWDHPKKRDALVQLAKLKIDYLATALPNTHLEDVKSAVERKFEKHLA